MLGPSLDPRFPARPGPGGAVGLVAAGWWWRTVRGGGTVVPDAAVDLLWQPGRDPWLAGPDTVPRPVSLPPGSTLLGVRLRPGVAGAVLAADLRHALGQEVPLSAVAPQAAVHRLIEQLEEALAGERREVRPADHDAVDTAGTGGPAAAAAALAGFALSRAGADWRPDPVVCDAAERLRAGRPVDLGGLSQRQFRRRFIRSFGYGPAFYRRVVRLDRATDLLDRHPHHTIAEVAALAGYTDESHLWRDATELTGSTPARLRAG